MIFNLTNLLHIIIFLEKKYRGELDIMISKEEDRSKGYGKEGVLHMIYYGIKFANIKNFFVKINEKNSSSIGLFKR